MTSGACLAAFRRCHALEGPRLLAPPRELLQLPLGPAQGPPRALDQVSLAPSQHPRIHATTSISVTVSARRWPREWGCGERSQETMYSNNEHTVIRLG